MTKYTCFSRFSVTKRCQKRGFNCWSWPIQQVWTPLHLISKTGHKWPWEADDWWRCSAGLAIELIKYRAEYYTNDCILRNFRYDFTFVFVFGLQTLFRWRCSFRRDIWLNKRLGSDPLRCKWMPWIYQFVALPRRWVFLEQDRKKQTATTKWSTFTY